MSPASAQDSTFAVPQLVSANIDSLIADSVRKAFIVNHRPIDSAELNRIELGQAKGFYGNYVSKYIAKGEFYKSNSQASKWFISKRNLPRLEWMFYSFALLFFFLSLINAVFSSYLQKVFRVFANEGFVYRQAKDQMTQAPLAAFLMNLLFILSGTIFVFFGLGGNRLFTGIERWQSMGLIFVFLVIVYAFKYLFLLFMGWIFNLREPFEGYVFIVFLNNKISGILMLFASFLMAFAEPGSSFFIFKLSLFLLAIIFLIRFIRGFQVFSKQARLGVFNFLLAVVSLEILPSAVVLKFTSRTFEFLMGGYL
ncbi:MAG: DUF4271 domain-containing protein [Chitinophagaceae bacterium]|nr:DUF4271 domain-containing protein [Chitinophagaceae bacterium]